MSIFQSWGRSIAPFFTSPTRWSRPGRLMLGGAVVLGILGSPTTMHAAFASPMTTHTAPTLHRPPPPPGSPGPQITPVGGPGEVTIISNQGWIPGGAPVEVNVWGDPTLSQHLLASQSFPVDPCGGFSEWVSSSCTSEYVWIDLHYYFPFTSNGGPVYVQVYQAQGSNFLEAVRTTYVGPMAYMNVVQDNCRYYPTVVQGNQFAPNASVRLELLDSSWNVLQTWWTTTTMLPNGDWGFSWSLPPQMSGDYHVMVDEQYPYGVTVGVGVSFCGT
jgi:hypothetical protein